MSNMERLYLAILFGIALAMQRVSPVEHHFTNQFAVYVPGGPDKARSLAKRHSCEFVGQIGSLEDHYLLESPNIAKRSLTDASESHRRLQDDPEVLWSEQQKTISRVKRGFEYASGGDSAQSWNSISQPAKPENMFFKDPLYSKQWYLHKGARGGFDMNVEKAWKRNYTGRGIAVSILDDGVQPDHPDLRQNYFPKASLDINGHDNDPTPTDDGNNKHGTRCAGEVAAVAGNDVCGVGVAYNAYIGGVRMLDGDVHDSVEATALSLNPQDVHIYSASWGPNDDGQTVDGPGKLAKIAFENGILKGRGGLGSVFVWASGNGGKSHDSCSCDGYTNSIWTISISSAAEDGSEPWYLEECPSTLATTYSSGSSMQRSIISTDLYMPHNNMQACTDKHTGTSAAAPLAAGIIALALEANPKLTWRDLQYLTMLSARPEPLMDDRWTVNAMGRKGKLWTSAETSFDSEDLLYFGNAFFTVSNKFGYGLMDADKMIQLAEKWITVPEQHVCESQHFEQQLPVVKGRLTVDVTTDGCQSSGQNAVYHLEHVQVVLSITAQHRGALNVYVTSPMGTTSELLPHRPLDNSRDGFHEWPFMSVQSWGENPSGTWHIEVKDEGFYNGQPNSFLVKWWVVMYGTEKDPLAIESKPTPNTPLVPFAFCHLSCKTCHGPTMDSCDSCFRGYYFHNSHCVETCPLGFSPSRSAPVPTCTSCPFKCVECTTSTDCVRCEEHYSLTNGQCVARNSTLNDGNCPTDFYFDFKLTQSCLPCHVDCSSCSGPKETNCIRCKPPKVFYGQCLDSCPTNFSNVNGICQVAGSGGFFEMIHWKDSHTYFLTATLACAVIVLIGIGIFVVLQRNSSRSRMVKPAGRQLGDGVKYEKAPLKPMDDSDEEVETFSKNNYASMVNI